MSYELGDLKSGIEVRPRQHVWIVQPPDAAIISVDEPAGYIENERMMVAMWPCGVTVGDRRPTRATVRGADQANAPGVHCVCVGRSHGYRVVVVACRGEVIDHHATLDA